MNDHLTLESIKSGVLAEAPGAITRGPYLPFASKLQPRNVDLRGHSGSRREQQLTSKSCVAFAFAKAIEVWCRIHRPINPQHDVSVLLLWYMARQLDNPNGPIENSAVTLSTMARVIEQLGIAKEEEWPWDLDSIYHTPSLNVLRSAFLNTVPGVARPIVDVGWSRPLCVHSALQKNFPVVFSCGMENLWLSYTRYNPLIGQVLQPAADPDFYHAMTILGYDREKDAFIAENSFGALWGYDGFAYVSSRLIAEGPTHGFWVVERGPTWTA